MREELHRTGQDGELCRTLAHPSSQRPGVALIWLLCDPCLQAPKAQASKEAKALAASNSSKGKKKVCSLLPCAMGRA